MSLTNLIQAYAYFVNPNLIDSLPPDATNVIYTHYLVIALVYVAPIPLIYQIEKNYFPDRKIFAKYHVVSLIIILVDIVFYGLTIPQVISSPALFESFSMVQYWYTTYTSWIIIVLFICSAFLYFGIKSSGRYRLYSILIFLGWGGNQLSNGIGQLLLYSTVVQPGTLEIIFVFKIVFAIVTAIGFVKLYALRG